MDNLPSFDQVLDAQNVSVMLQIQHWLKYELLTPQFWLLISLLILPWFVWLKLVDKKRFQTILIYGLLISTVATLLDEVGCQLNLWDYLYDIEPLFPRMTPMNYTVLPVLYMLVYQYFTPWRSFIIANIVASAVYSFIAEPLLVKSGIYVILEWQHIYSFPIYFLLAIIFKLILNWIIKVQQSNT